jgi:hypothetical protein
LQERLQPALNKTTHQSIIYDYMQCSALVFEDPRIPIGPRMEWPRRTKSRLRPRPNFWTDVPST